MPRAFARVDAVMLEARAAVLTQRTVTDAARRAGIDAAIACLDLTTLEGTDTPGSVRALCARAVDPAPGAPHVAAVCVYPALVSAAKAALGGSPVAVASVAGAFPSGLSPRSVKVADAAAAREAGADEIDMVIDRGAFLAGERGRVAEEIAATRDACRGAVLKVILEAGELGSYAAVRAAADLALEAGADFVKTSTGKARVSTTPAIALVLCEAVRDFERRTGRAAGVKLAGGIRSAGAALGYVALVAETLGSAFLQPRRFRIGASALLYDLAAQRDRDDALAGTLQAVR